MSHAEPTPRTTTDFDELRAILLRCVRVSAPSWLAGDVEDIVHGAMEKLLPKLAAEARSGYPVAYLLRVANHAVIDEIRRVTRRREDALPGDDALPPAHHGDPGQAARATEVGDGITDCLHRLKPERRDAVTLYLQGHKVPEAAHILGWGRKRVENLTHRGLAELRKCLDRKGLRR